MRKRRFRPSAVHHIYQRPVNGIVLFHTRRDFLVFLTIFFMVKKKHRVRMSFWKRTRKKKCRHLSRNTHRNSSKSTTVPWTVHQEGYSPDDSDARRSEMTKKHEAPSPILTTMHPNASCVTMPSNTSGISLLMRRKSILFPILSTLPNAQMQ